MKKYFITACILFFTASVFSQQYVTITASATKKEFQLSEKIRVNVKASIQDGFHINANKVADEDLIPTSLKVESNDFKLAGVSWPGSKKYKFSFSETELDVYEGSINIVVSLKANKNLKPGKYEVSGTLHYQACNDRACFAPKDIEFTVQLTMKEDSVKNDSTKINKKDSTEKTDSTDLGQKKDTSKTNTSLKENKRDTSQTVTSIDKKNEIADYIASKGLILTLILIFLGGLALNLTPCVYPLIPITISFFGANATGGKTQKLAMAIVYVLGMSVTYSILGLVAALTGGLFGSMLQSPIVVGVFVLILLTLALSMFGAYEIRIPQSLANISGKNRTGYAGTALMGLTVGFIAAPCIGPFVLSLLVYVGQIGSPFLGFLLFFVLAVGLGFPYIFLALFSGSISKLPRSGEWMEGVKIIFGLLMVGMAMYTARPLMGDKIYEIIFPVYLVLAGAFLILFDRKAITAVTYTRIKYVIAIVGIIYGAMNLHFGEEQTAGKLEWQDLKSMQQVDESIKKAGKPTMIDFYADWCAQCKELDKYTYVDPKIIEASKKFNNIKIDLTKGDKEIESRFKIQGLPVVAFIDANGKEREDLRVTGFLKAEEFLKVMEKAK